MKIFGIELFNRSRRGEELIGHARNNIKDSAFLPDFSSATRSILTQNDLFVLTPDDLQAAAKEQKQKQKRGKSLQLTPKGVYELKMLNEDGFAIKTDPVYVDEQINSFKERLGLIKSSEYDMGNGVIEITSMLIRLENRKKYPEFKDFYSQYPYTTTKKINELVKAHDYLKLGKVEQFIADMPNEAVEVMKVYSKKTEQLCKKKPLYFIIASKNDFKKTETRKDPILLVQSPFGHFWQILGAWDKEMLLLDEL